MNTANGAIEGVEIGPHCLFCYVCDSDLVGVASRGANLLYTLHSPEYESQVLES